VTSPFHFIPHYSPVRPTAAPVGDGWVHEVKFDATASLSEERQRSAA